VTAGPVHPAARMSEQTRIAMIRVGEQLIVYDHTGWYKNMFILLAADLPRDLPGASHYFCSCSEPLMQ
jgi:hypothetical protein